MRVCYTKAQAVCARWPRCAAGLRVPRCVRKLTYSSVVPVSCSFLCSACLWVPPRVSSSVSLLGRQSSVKTRPLSAGPAPRILQCRFIINITRAKKKSMPESINCIAYISGKSLRWLTQEADKGRGRLEKRRPLMLCNILLEQFICCSSSCFKNRAVVPQVYHAAPLKSSGPFVGTNIR